MNSKVMPLGQADWTLNVPGLAEFDLETRRRLRTLCHLVTAPEGAQIFGEGHACEAYLILLEGQVRVQKVAENGREIVLYRLGAGETCIVTTACLMSGSAYDAEAVTETPIRGQALPLSGFRQMLSESAAFRDFVFKAYGTRLSELLMLIEEVAFKRVDQRLAAWLLQRGPGPIDVTHQELAIELGTAREVISRQLKDFERRHMVQLGRGALSVTDPVALGRLADTCVT